MSDDKVTLTIQKIVGRRGFLSAVVGGVLALLAGCAPTAKNDDTEARLSALEEKVSQLEQQLSSVKEQEPGSADRFQPLAQMEGGMNERVVFNKSELTITNPEGVLLNLVATHGHVGIRFYKDFDFGNEKVTNPWHMGYIEGVDGYQGLAILRDWRFTAAIWDEDGRLLLGRLHPHPPANEPSKARLHVRGTVDEVQAVVQASAGQAADIFQVINGDGTAHLAVNNAGNVVIGSSEQPQEVILYDTQDKSAYSLKVTNGRLALTRT
jgi:outer membrane murein-binding lipoprotein Lpp